MFRDAENHAWDEFETLGMGWTWQETATASFLTLWGLLLTKIRKCWLKLESTEIYALLPFTVSLKGKAKP